MFPSCWLSLKRALQGGINTPDCQSSERNKWTGGPNFNLEKLSQCLHSYSQQLEAHRKHFWRDWELLENSRHLFKINIWPWTSISSKLRPTKHAQNTLPPSHTYRAPKLAFFFFFNIKVFFFIFYFWLHWVFVAARGLSLVAASGGWSSLQRVGFSLQWLLLLWSMGSRHTGFSSCGMRGAQ